ncbi:MAG TPA: CBS domain-containing protein [Candidatus Limnocylindrales bacterium]|nr:CBS domain-containing protein [Candidatus Limnocylindrales bacterium]
MLTIRDVMTAPVATVRPTDLLKDVAQILVTREVSGLPVVDDTGAIVGVLSEADFLVKEQGRLPATRRVHRLLGANGRRHALEAKQSARTAGELMTSPAVTIGPRRPISEAARLMTERQINRLPVVDDGRLVGIVSRADLVRAFARSDEELARTIREDVLLRILWLDPESFTVKVQDGIASISGRVERRSTSELVRETVAMVPGIVDVTANLPWTVDDRDLEIAERDLAFPHGLR